ncbi:MAG: Rieske 2Fe-2S domain-containing protein, partial [Thermodesulfobacteriota bacterium]
MQHAVQAQPISPLAWPRAEGARVPYQVFLDPAIYAQEQERVFRGPTWNYVALEAELPRPGDFKATFVGDTPVVVTRGREGSLHAFVNR